MLSSIQHDKKKTLGEGSALT